jgi:NifU-like protein
MHGGEERPRLVCRCLGVASTRIYAAVRTEQLATVPEVTKAIRAGGGCGMCHPEIEEILAEVHGRPVDPAVSLENQLICRQETQARIEGSLESLIRPQLASRGTRLGTVEVLGLRVRVELHGGDEAAALELVRTTLRRFVCEDLEVERLAARC